MRYGEPLDLSRYYDRRDDPFVLRSATDELMYEIMLLSEQEYVDEYAAKVKSGEVDVGSTATRDDEPGATRQVDAPSRRAADRARGGGPAHPSLPSGSSSSDAELMQ
jgi:1-acyl-sn-glycerol-3-phosphate acyltransferase